MWIDGFAKIITVSVLGKQRAQPIFGKGGVGTLLLPMAAADQQAERKRVRSAVGPFRREPWKNSPLPSGVRGLCDLGVLGFVCTGSEVLSGQGLWHRRTACKDADPANGALPERVCTRRGRMQ